MLADSQPLSYIPDMKLSCDPSGLACQIRLLNVLEPATAECGAFAILRDTAGLDPAKAKTQADIASSLMRQALSIYPFYTPLVAMLGKISGLSPHPPGFAAWFAALRPILKSVGPVDEAAVADCREACQPSDSLACMLRPDIHPALAGQALLTLWRRGRLAGHLDRAADFAATQPGAFMTPLIARAAFQAGESALARRLLQAAPTPPTALSQELLADLHGADGDVQAERAALLAALATEPGLPHAVRRLTGLRAASRPGSHAPLACVICHNDSEAARLTLDNLRQRRLPPGHITLLDAGSTPEQVQALRALTSDTVSLIHLPTHPGWPALRTWAINLPQSADFETILILRAGVTLAPYGLTLLAGTLASTEQAVSVGPKVALSSGPHALGRGFVHFCGDDPDPVLLAAGEGHPDLGRLDHVALCASASEDIRLYSLTRMRRLGLSSFDIRYAPEGLETADHDLTARLRDGLTLFDGRIEAIAPPREEISFAASNLAANRLKLECKFGPELNRLRELTLTDEAQDFLTCLEPVLSELPPRARIFWKKLIQAI